MTKSKSSMVTRDTLYLTIDTFLDVVEKRNFTLLSVVGYLFRVVAGNRNLLRGSNWNTLCITKTGNVFVARWVIPLVTIPLLDSAIIHWICWIMSFRENSIKRILFKRILFCIWFVKLDELDEFEKNQSRVTEGYWKLLC